MMQNESVLTRVVRAGAGVAIAGAFLMLGPIFSITRQKLGQNASVPWWVWAAFALGALAITGCVQVGKTHVALAVRAVGALASLGGFAIYGTMLVAELRHGHGPGLLVDGLVLAAVGFVLALIGSVRLSVKALLGVGEAWAGKGVRARWRKPEERRE